MLVLTVRGTHLLSMGRNSRKRDADLALWRDEVREAVRYFSEVGAFAGLRRLFVLVGMALTVSGLISPILGEVASPPQKSTPVRVEKTEDGVEAAVSFHAKNKLLLLQSSASDSSKHPLPMKQRVVRWEPLLRKLFAQQPKEPEYSVSVGEYAELNRRLANAAVASGEWNLQTGAPKNGDASAALKKLIEKNGLHRELLQLFETLGYDLAVGSAESVVLCRWKEIPKTAEEPAAPAVSVPPDALVPCGASLLFRATAKPQQPK